MTPEEKNLLLKDLCARLQYGVKVQVNTITNHIPTLKGLLSDNLFLQFDYAKPIKNGDSTYNLNVDSIKPYLRPLSSMTEEEIYEMKRICDEEDLRDECGNTVSTIYGMTVLYGEVEDVYPYNLKIKISPNLNYFVLDFFNAHYFDYRGLIEKGLALEAPEGMYNF